jgi:hypothetical protein
VVVLTQLKVTVACGDEIIDGGTEPDLDVPAFGGRR